MRAHEVRGAGRLRLRQWRGEEHGWRKSARTVVDDRPGVVAGERHVPEQRRRVHVRREVGQPASATQHHLIGQRRGEAEPRRQVRVVRLHVHGTGDAVLAGNEQRQRLDVEVGDRILLLGQRRVDVISDAEVEREPVGRAPVVLDERARLDGVVVRHHDLEVTRCRCRVAQQQRRNRVATRSAGPAVGELLGETSSCPMAIRRRLASTHRGRSRRRPS